MSAISSDYDTDPGRWRSWQPAWDVHQLVASELTGPILDVGCGDGRLASELDHRIIWYGLDSSPTQLARNSFRPVVLGDMALLPFRDGTFAEVTHLWCLYHLPNPVLAIWEARRVLATGGRYYACTAARTNDPELLWEGYPPSSFDAEEALSIVKSVFADAQAQIWDDKLLTLRTRDELQAYCRHHAIPLARASSLEVPLSVTKRGVLVRATKS